MDRSQPSSLSFDEVCIDLAGHRLWRGGVEQALEPKAFGVLVLLVQSPGRVFARDEILDAVWGHRHVTPGVLNRVMTLLRHALGEDAHSPRYMHTVHGVGYRFDLPAQDAPSVPSVEAAVAVEPALASTLSEDPPAPLPRRRATDGIGGAGSNRRWAWLLGIMLIALVGAYAARRHDPGANVPTPPSGIALPTPPALVVLPLKSIGASEATDIIAAGLSEELIGSLAQIDGLRVIARESTRLAAAETRDPAQLAQRLGITHSLEGSLQQSGQSLRIRLRLLDARGGALWTKEFDRDASEVLQLQRDIAAVVAASLTLRLGLSTLPSKSGDSEFLRRYLAAKAIARRGDLPSNQSTEVAENEFRALLRERPDDARIHASLAMAIHARTLREPTHPSVPVLRAEALHEAGIAQRLDASLPEPYVVQGEAACDANDWERCIELKGLARARGAYQDNVSGYAFALAQLGYLDRAEAILREQIAHDPINTQPHFLFGRLLDTLGQHDKAHRQFKAHRTPNDVYGRWFNAVWRRDHAEALRIAEGEMGLPTSPDNYAALLKPGYVATSRALLDPAQWPAAIEAADRFERETGLVNFCRVLAPDAPAHAAGLISKLNGVRQRGYSSWDLLLWTKDLAYLRRDPAFQAYLRDNGILAYWRKHGFPKQCRPDDDGAYCE